MDKLKIKLLGNYVLFALSLLIPLLPALYNGYPFYFYDDAGYIVSAFLRTAMPQRPPGYSLLLYFFMSAPSLWFLIVFQSIISSYSVFRFLKLFIHKNIYQIHLIVILALTAFTSFAWFVGFLMPDIFIGIGALAMFVIIFEQSSYRNKIVPAIILFISALVHTSHPPSLILTAVAAALVVFFYDKKNMRRYLAGIILALVIIISSVASGMIANINYKFAYNQAAHAFIMGRLEEIGILQEFLFKNCLTENYKLCDFEPKFIKTSKGGFLWQKDSPLTLVGWNESRDEYKTIIKKIFIQRDYALKFILDGLWSGFESLADDDLVSFGTKYEGKAESYYKVIVKHFPGDIEFLENSKQFTETNALQKIAGQYFMIFSIISLILLLYFVFARLTGKLEKIVIILLIFFTLANAIVTATFSSILDSRYKARVSWLVPLMAITSILKKKR